MTLLSLFMSGILSASNGWLFFASIPTFYHAQRKGDGYPLLLAYNGSEDETGSACQWSETKEHHHRHHRHHHSSRSLPLEPIHSSNADDRFATSQQESVNPPTDKCDSLHTISVPSPLEYPATPCFSQTVSPIGTFDGHASTSFISTSDDTLCDHCDTLLRREIPADHIPSVIRALALFEARERSSLSVSEVDLIVQFDEREILALTDAFAMLQL